ncbi:MAG: hypothetical protein V3R94_05585, partial [Acidobacteriota bacterium]
MNQYLIAFLKLVKPVNWEDFMDSKQRTSSAVLDTFFAPAERATKEQLEREVANIASSSVVRGLVQSVAGLLAILNDKRQVVSVNQEMLSHLGVENISDILGLRIGDVLGCEHASEGPAGCGTTKHCRSCGAALATVSAMKKEEPIERTCALSVDHG